jgi:hypothetical protein
VRTSIGRQTLPLSSGGNDRDKTVQTLYVAVDFEFKLTMFADVGMLESNFETQKRGIVGTTFKHQI